MAQLKSLIVNGASRFIGDIFGNKAQLTILDAPTAAGGTSYGPGTNGQVLKSNGTSIYWGNDNNSGGTVTSVRVQATSPVVSSQSAAQTGTLDTTISLDNGYGDTKNPYASKTKNWVLASPGDADGVPSFRALIAADIPNLSTDKLTSGTLPTGRGGTGNTSFTASRLVYTNTATKLSSSTIESDGNYITAPSGNIISGTWAANTAGSAERQVGVHNGAGKIYMYSAASTSGNRGIFLYNAAGTSGSGLVFNQDNRISVIAQFATNVLPINNTYTMGGSSFYWRAAYINGFGTIHWGNMYNPVLNSSDPVITADRWRGLNRVLPGGGADYYRPTNAFFGIKSSSIKFEYTTNGGSTWTTKDIDIRNFFNESTMTITPGFNNAGTGFDQYDATSTSSTTGGGSSAVYAANYWTNKGVRITIDVWDEARSGTIDMIILRFGTAGNDNKSHYKIERLHHSDLSNEANADAWTTIHESQSTDWRSNDRIHTIYPSQFYLSGMSTGTTANYAQKIRITFIVDAWPTAYRYAPRLLSFAGFSTSSSLGTGNTATGSEFARAMVSQGTPYIIENRITGVLGFDSDLLPRSRPTEGAAIVTDNIHSIGTSNRRWAHMYATTFHGALDGNASTATDALSLKTVGDNRSVATTPNNYANRLIFQGLKYNSQINSPTSDTTYSYLIGLRGWADNSGGNAHELAFNDIGVYWRKGATTSWGSWKQIAFTDSDITGNANSASSLSSSGTIITDLASTSAVTYTSGGNITPGIKNTLPISHGGTGKTTRVEAYKALAYAGAFTGDIDATDIEVGIRSLSNATSYTGESLKTDLNRTSLPNWAMFYQSPSYNTQMIIEGNPGCIYLRSKEGDPSHWLTWHVLKEKPDEAGNADTATTASKLGTSDIGAADRPIYLDDGTAKQTTYRMAGTNAAASTGITFSNDLDTGIWYVNGISSSADQTALYGVSDGVIIANKYSSNWISEIYQDYRTGQIALRGKNNGVWQAWRKVLDSSNYTDYTVSKTGSGASGSWGIDITGTASKVTTTDIKESATDIQIVGVTSGATTTLKRKSNITLHTSSSGGGPRIIVTDSNSLTINEVADQIRKGWFGFSENGQNFGVYSSDPDSIAQYLICQKYTGKIGIGTKDVSENYNITLAGSVHITSTASNGLSAGTSAVTIGSLTGTHLGIAKAGIQAKSDATTAATLNLNWYGGTVQLGSSTTKTAPTTVYGSVTPGVDTSYDLGSSSLKWNNIYGTLKGNADTATKATQDESGNNIKATYAASFSISDQVITLKNKNNASLGTVTVPAKVKQTVDTSGYDYAILTKDSTAVTTTTAEAKFSANVTINPSQKAITASTYKVTSNAQITYNTSNGCLEIIVA